MSKLMIAMFVGAGLGFAGASMAQMNSPTTSPTQMSKANYNQAIKDALDRSGRRHSVQGRPAGVLVALRKRQGHLSRRSKGQEQRRQG